MRRKLIHFGTSLLQDTGINIVNEHDQRNLWRFIIIFSTFVWADILCGIFSITNSNDFYTFIIPIPYIATALIVQSGIYFIYHHRKTIGEMFNQMDENFYIYPDEDRLQVEYPWYLEEKNITTLMTVTKYCAFTLFFMISLPIFGEIMYYGRIKTMLYPMWTPWELNSLKVELIAFLFQSVQGFCGLWLNYTVIVFLLITVIEFLRQNRRLTAAVRSLDHRSSEQVTLQKNECFDIVLHRNLVHCIKHQQILHRNFHLFEIWFSIFFSIELTVSAVTFTFALYVAMNAPSWGQILNYFSVVIFVWINLFVRCLISEIFSNLNNNLAEDVLWNTPWYKANKEDQKLFTMFHLFASQPFRLFGLSIFEATRITFGKLVRMTYSFFNVLKRKDY